MIRTPHLLLIAFATVAIGALLMSVAWRVPEAMTITEAGDAVVEQPRRVDAFDGMSLPPKATLIARTQPSIVTYQGTTVFVEPHTNVQLKGISADSLRLFSTRGRTRVTPDRTLEYCTRRVCTTTQTPVRFTYITPGEIVIVEPEGNATVRFGDQTFALAVGDTLSIDELSGDIVSSTSTLP